MYQTDRRAKSMSFITHGDLFEIFILYDIMGESLLLRLLLQPMQGEEGSVAPYYMLSFTEYLPGVLIRTGRTDEPTMFLLA